MTTTTTASLTTITCRVWKPDLQGKSNLSSVNPRFEGTGGLPQVQRRMFVRENQPVYFPGRISSSPFTDAFPLPAVPAFLGDSASPRDAQTLRRRRHQHLHRRGAATSRLKTAPTDRKNKLVASTRSCMNHGAVTVVSAKYLLESTRQCDNAMSFQKQGVY
jgi:hypothetical protein